MRCLVLVVGCLMCVACCLLFVVSCLWFVNACCSLCVVCCRSLVLVRCVLVVRVSLAFAYAPVCLFVCLLAACCLQCVARVALSVVCCSLCVIGWPLFVG